MKGNRGKTCSGPLSDVRVLDLTVNAFGPIATQQLGDMGAAIIKIEAPEGDPIRDLGPKRSAGMSAMFLNMNRNKRSVVLDLKSVNGRAALNRLIAGADVVIHTMRPAAAERLGLGYEEISAIRTDIILASGGGYRPDSSFGGLPAYDDIIQGRSGIAAVTQEKGGDPAYAPSILIDKLCGYVLAHAVTGALYYRAVTGQGQEVHVPMTDVATAFNLLDHFGAATFDPPIGAFGYGRALMPYHRPFPTRDGYICVACITTEQWHRLFEVVDRPEMAQDSRFVDVGARTQNIAELYKAVGKALLDHSVDEWVARLDAADIPNSPVNRFADLECDPYLAETGFFAPADHPTEGAIRTLPILPIYGVTPGKLRHHAPSLGVDTAEVLREAGFSEDEIKGVSR